MALRIVACRIALASACAAVASAPQSAGAMTLAFYAPWDERAEASLQIHAGQIDVLAPAWISVIGRRDDVQLDDSTPNRAALAALPRAPTLLPVVQNARDGVWHGAEAAALLASPARRKTLLDQLVVEVTACGGSGVVFDFEDLPPRAHPAYMTLLSEARALFATRRWQVAVSVPANDEDWDLAAYGRAADLVILMAYDEHWPTSAPGPIASPAWFAQATKTAITQVPAAKLVVGLASYGYDWPARGAAHALSVSAAKALAAREGVTPTRSAPNAELHFAYTAKGVRHQVWVIDAQASRAEADTARALGESSLALWRLGIEDPALWRWFGAPGG